LRHAITALELLGASILAALAVTATVSAHAEYESSAPAAGEVVATAPASVTVNFNGEMQKTPGTYALTVTSPAGAVTAGAPTVSADGRSMTVSLQPGLANGTYTVGWMTTGAEDGHERSGTFMFSVGAASAPAPMPTPMPADDHDHGDTADPGSSMDHGSMDHGAMDHEGMDHNAMMEGGPVVTGLVVVPLLEQNGSGVDGRVEILPADGGMKSQVGVYVNGIAPGSAHMSHVHMQSVCGGTPGSHAGDLLDLTSDGVPHGSSVTVLDVPFGALVDGKHAIMVHAGATGGDKAVLACAVIPGQPRAAATITLPSAGSGAAAAGGTYPLLLGLVALGLASISAGAFALAWTRNR